MRTALTLAVASMLVATTMATTAFAGSQTTRVPLTQASPILRTTPKSWTWARTSFKE